MPNPRLSIKQRDAAWGYIFVAPMLLLTGVFVAWPVIGSFRIAFYNWSGIGEPEQFVGWRHFITVAKDPFFWNAFKNTMVYTLVLVPIQLSLALGLAVVLNQPKLRASTLYRVIYFLPVVTSAAIVGIVMSLLLGNFSAELSAPLMEAGLLMRPLDILGSPSLAMAAVIGVGIWHTLGYNLVYFLAALQTVPQELHDAAKVDGADSLQQFVHVTLPCITPVGLVILCLAILGCLNVFDLVMTLTNGGPYYATDVVSTYVYGYAFTASRGDSTANVGLASSASIFMGLIIMAITLLQALALKKLRARRELEARP